MNIFVLSALYLTFNLYLGVFQLFQSVPVCRCDSSHGNQAYWETPPSVRSNTFDRQLWKYVHIINILQSHTSDSLLDLLNIAKEKMKQLILLHYNTGPK